MEFRAAMMQSNHQKPDFDAAKQLQKISRGRGS
jgi:hypothetical protein